MNETDLKSIEKRIQDTQAEFQTIEVKRSKTQATERLFDTLSSFSYQDDIRPVERATVSSLNYEKTEEYLKLLKKDKPNLSSLEDGQILELMSIIREGKPTLAAEFMFGLYPQAYFPQLSIIAVSVPGTEIGDTDIDGSRFIDNQRIEGTIPDMVDAALQFVRRNTRKKTIIDPDTGKRRDKTDYPINSVREALLNALVHRDYSIHTEGMPIQLSIFADRLEITNPGGLYGRLTLDTLGKVQPDTRNPVLATALEVMDVTENRYSGIPTIRRELKEHGLPAPEFRNERGEFTICFRLSDEIETKNNNIDIIDFCKTPRTRQEIAKYLGLSSVTYAMKKYVQPLIDSGTIKMSVPDAPSSPNQKYYSGEND